MKLKRIFTIFFVLIFLVVNIHSICFAASVPVTEENLNNVLHNFVSSDANDGNYEIVMSDGKMEVKIDGESYVLNYDLTDNPTFTFSIPIKQGMTYEEFEEQTNHLNLPMMGYIGVANVHGVNFEDATMYFAMCILMNAFSNISSGYIIVEDDTTVEGSDATVIYKSDFGNHVMEYVNSMYATKQVFTDSAEMEGFDTFTWTIEETDVTSTSCNLLSTLTVNLDADFSEINGYAESMDPYSDITEQSADYTIKLKVGQECHIQSSEKIIGYEFSGASCIEFNDDKDVITAVKPGTAKGYLYIGNSDNKKSIYILVEENTGNNVLDSIILKLDNDNNKTESSEINIDNTISTTILPKTGINIIIVLTIGILVLFAIILQIKIKQYKDI